MAGTATADHGLVDINNTGNGGKVTLTGATLHGDVVKVGALGANGTLVVDGANISADSAIKLYAGGSNGTVQFKDNVTLSGTSVKTIYGQTVTISNGKIVTVLGPGPANVFTNVPNYTGFGGNGSTSGTFAGQGATTQPLNAGAGILKTPLVREKFPKDLAVSRMHAAACRLLYFLADIPSMISRPRTPVLAPRQRAFAAPGRNLSAVDHRRSRCSMFSHAKK